MLKERDFGLPRDAQEKRVAVGYELVVPSQPPARDGWNNPRRVLKGWIRSGRQWPRVSSPRVREESEGVPPSFNRVCFPIFALALQCFLEKIRKQSHRCDYLKIFFLTGAHQVLAEGGETFSTFSAGELLSMWAEQQLKELTSEALTHNVRSTQRARLPSTQFLRSRFEFRSKSFTAAVGFLFTTRTLGL
mmetsp:Transcript_122383/g.280417  ORF Transcript_122383/g.280417 Transcript_122383/m.280417 type:complete len:190 (-) Transcript_122383:1220-1789(-)